MRLSAMLLPSSYFSFFALTPPPPLFLFFLFFLYLLPFLSLDQLERVFLRLGHADTDEQLQDVISKFLPPVLLKLSSAQEGVRKKVSLQ